MNRWVCPFLGALSVTALALVTSVGDAAGQPPPPTDLLSKLFPIPLGPGATPSASPDEQAPSRATVDLADPAACYRELAALASFAFGIDSPHDFAPNAVGKDVGLFPHDPDEQIDRTIRFDHLRRSNDPKFVAAVDRVREISLRAWRVNRADYDFGDVPARGDTRFDMLLTAYLHVALKMAEESSARAAATTTRRTLNGQIESFDERRFNQLMATEGSASRHAREAFDEARDRPARLKQVSKTLNALRRSIQDDMAAAWEQDLLPALRRASGPLADAPPVEVLAPEKTLPPVKNLVFAPTSVLIRNRSDKPLHHLVIRLAFRNESGDQASWYAYLPSLDPSHFLISYAYNTPWGLEWYSPRVETDADVLAAEASATNLHLEQPTPRHYTEPKRGASRNANLMSRDDRLAALRAEQAKADELFPLLEQLYGTPANPETARARLLAQIQRGPTYRASDPADGSPITLTVHSIDPATSTLHAQLTRPRYARGVPGENPLVTEPMLGRFVEEVDRGCVLALIPATPSRSEILRATTPPPAPASSRANKSTKSTLPRRTNRSIVAPPRKKPQDAPRSSPRKLARNADPKEVEEVLKARGEGEAVATKAIEDRWVGGETVVLTAPSDIAFHALPNIPPSNIIGPAAKRRYEAERDKMTRTRTAPYVVFLTPDGQLALQPPPDAHRKVTSTPLSKGR